MSAPGPEQGGNGQHGFTRGRVIRDVLLLVLARLGSVLVISALLLLLRVPLIVAVLLALVITSGLSLVMFRGLRDRINSGVAEWDRQRRARKEELRRELREDE